MKIKFEIPCYDFDPLSINNGFIKIPNKTGVYIWGYWIWIDGKKTFCPMNVGESGKGSGNLRNRLINHYSSYFENKDDGTAAFFEVNKYMSQESIDELYRQLGEYNNLSRSGAKRMTEIKAKKAKELTRLIFYQDKNFFDFKINTGNENIGFYSLIEFLKKEKTKGKLVHGQLLNKIFESREVHLNNFFCIYAILPNEIDGQKRKKIENTVNKALRDKLGIATIADSKKEIYPNLEINLSVIKNDLVKISGKKDYINIQGYYDSGLTIKINK